MMFESRVNVCLNQEFSEEMANKGAIMLVRKVSLTPELAEFLDEEVASGEYASASEVLRDALRLLKRDRDMGREKLKGLRREIALGIEQTEPEAVSDRTRVEIATDVLRNWR
jgi:antitoxin ParD1/3/4